MILLGFKVAACHLYNLLIDSTGHLMSKSTLTATINFQSACKNMVEEIHNKRSKTFTDAPTSLREASKKQYFLGNISNLRGVYVYVNLPNSFGCAQIISRC